MPRPLATSQPHWRRRAMPMPICRMLADPLAAAIAKQFPARFNGQSDSRAASLRIALNNALAEHVYLGARPQALPWVAVSPSSRPLPPPWTATQWTLRKRWVQSTALARSRRSCPRGASILACGGLHDRAGD